MRETRGFTWRGVTFCIHASLVSHVVLHSLPAHLEVPAMLLHSVAVFRGGRTWPLLRPVAMPDFCLTSWGIVAVVGRLSSMGRFGRRGLLVRPLYSFSASKIWGLGSGNSGADLLGHVPDSLAAPRLAASPHVWPGCLGSVSTTSSSLQRIEFPTIPLGQSTASLIAFSCATRDCLRFLDWRDSFTMPP